jgi:hypothetical protein
MKTDGTTDFYSAIEESLRKEPVQIVDRTNMPEIKEFTLGRSDPISGSKKQDPDPSEVSPWERTFSPQQRLITMSSEHKRRGGRIH